MTRPPIRWGILGAAKVNRRAIPAIQATADGCVAAIASRSLSKAQAVAAQYGVPCAHGSYEALLADAAIDAVYNPLPNSLHKIWTIRAAQAGKHVLCEKPMAIDAAECREMEAACDAAGVVLMEGLMYRFHPQIRRCLELVKAGAIGRVQMVRSAFSYPLNDPGNIRLRRDLGGGALFDPGCYCVNVTRLMVGEEPVRASAFAVFQPDNGVDETLCGQLQFPGGAIGAFDCSFKTQFRQFLEVVGSDGKIDLAAPFLKRTDDATIVVRRGDDIETIVVPGVDHYRLMFDHFTKCVLDGGAPAYPAADAVHNLVAVDALYASARQQQLLNRSL